MGKTAFITGANGISGGAFLEHLVNNTTSDDWSSIIITSRSPFKATVSDPRITFIPLDFTKDVDTLVSQMKETCAPVTHAYFCSYVHRDDFQELNTANASLFDNFLDSLEGVAHNLENVTLETGGKYYQIHLRPMPFPLQEDAPRVVDEKVGNFYFPQEDKLAQSQKGKKWTWNVVRPMGIIGATSKPNGMNFALSMAIYILVERELGSQAPLLTNERFWEGGIDDFSYAPLIADLAIYVSTHANCANQAFNASNGDVQPWRYFWPRVASYFGVDASTEQTFTKPKAAEGEIQLEQSWTEWAKDKREVWEKLCDKQGVPGAKSTFDYGTWALNDWAFGRTWWHTPSASKARKFGYTGFKDSYDCMVETFDRFKQSGLLPQ